MSWKGFGRKWSRPNCRYYTGIRLEGLRKNHEKLSQDSRSPGRDLNPEPPEYEAGVLTTQPRRSVYDKQILADQRNETWHTIT
jgi:hypothetical protein